MNSSEQVHYFFGLLPSIQGIHIIAWWINNIFSNSWAARAYSGWFRKWHKYCYLSLHFEYHIPVLPQSKPDVSCEQISCWPLVYLAWTVSQWPKRFSYFFVEIK
jgi:hypothetical protein